MKDNKLLVITSYPSRGSTHSRKTVGVASYTKMLITALKDVSNKQITVLAEKMSGRKSYTEDGIKVRRIWDKNSITSILSLCSQIIFSEQKTVMLSFEGFMFGSFLNSTLVFLSLLVSRILGKKTVVIQHQVVHDFKPFGKGELQSAILGLLIKPFYVLENLASSKIIVFEEGLKQQLGNLEKVEVLPHLVFSTRKVRKAVARERLGWSKNKKYILYFGYVAPYKGIDWLVSNWPESSKAKLVIAGDINPNYKEDQKTVSFVDDVKKQAKSKHILTTGFVPESDIKYYFSAADAVILPYKIFMSSSGPLAFAFAHKKPVLLSSALSSYVKSVDFNNVMESCDLSAKELTFKFSRNSLEQALTGVKKNAEKLEQFSAFMSEARSKKVIAQKLNNILNFDNQSAIGEVILSKVS